MIIEAMKQALEALEKYSGVDQRACDAEDALRTAIEQAEKQEPVAFKIYKPTPPRGAISNVRDSELPWVYDQDPSSGNVASMWVTPVKATPQPQRDTWKNAAIRLGEELSSVGPDGYYNMTAEQWLDWAIDQQPRGKNSLPQPQREWVGLTDEEIKHIEETTTCLQNESWLRNLTRNLEAKLKEKNT